MLRVLGPELLQAGKNAATVADRAQSDRAQGQGGQCKTAQNQEGYLHRIGHRHGFEPAEHLIGQRKSTEYDQRGELMQPGHACDRERTEPQDRSQIHEHVQHQPEHRHHRTNAFAKAFLEKLRHRVDVVAQEDRQKPLGDDQQGQRRQPLVRRDRKPGRVARAGHADDLFGRDVRCDRRGADSPPRQGSAREEVVLRVFLVADLFARDPLCQSEHAGQINQYDRDIEHGQLHTAFSLFSVACRPAFPCDHRSANRCSGRPAAPAICAQNTPPACGSRSSCAALMFSRAVVR